MIQGKPAVLFVCERNAGRSRIDISGARPKGLTPGALDGVDVVVTMGCGDACPHVPDARTIDWDLPDPAGLPPAEVAAIRDEIASRTADLDAEIAAGA